MIRVNLPPGCRSLRMEDGTRYRASREGGFVNVSEAHAAAINAMPGNGTAGLVSAQPGQYAAVGGPGRNCTACRFKAYAWTTTCPRCGSATEAA